MPDKLTDSEIVKALECCIKSSHFGECFENKCPLASENGCKVGKETLYPYAFDLINRQKAENLKLNTELAIKELEYSMLERERAEDIGKFVEELKNLKASAYKELIDKHSYPHPESLTERIVYVSDIIEMAGEDK